MRQTSAKVERNMHRTLRVFFIDEQMWRMLSKAEYVNGIKTITWFSLQCVTNVRNSHSLFDLIPVFFKTYTEAIEIL